ncbi:hypothetical protein HYH02_006014 [Chlamydomonas schloesseri]|uniref:ACT domain-containing protein n=1 Tax=Chlamydomonas schloesseri TaxID=2026947 RepID=A0A836B620_9CHLO|nr:hypothetical protein HYH02_006014 [Chlamydomonas schloesseri]|eukprot:KAG2448657.1 hypothetical protein HYH02_006014 [Chlamydomonas schloesseri]
MQRTSVGRDIAAKPVAVAPVLRRTPTCRIAPGRADRSTRNHSAPALVAKAPASSHVESNGAHSAPVPAPASTSRDASDAAASSALSANLLLICPDQKGVIAAVSQLLYGFGCNIVASDQFTDSSSSMFFQRITFDFSEIVIGPGNTAVLERAIAELANRFNMKWKISYTNKVKRMAVLVSKQDHCLYDLLIRHRSGELRCEIPLIISNHPDLKHIADTFDVPFVHLPLDKNNKEAQEEALEKLLKDEKIDVVILARYMQIFTQGFCERHWEHTINIHHSFLPAFEGARPYHRAHERGVKIIGATAHFATAELDAGPIIDQAVARITHRDNVEDMIRKGRDLERMVLARAVRWHLDDRVMVYNNKTVVFED